MHTNRISLARKIILSVAAALALALLSGCETVTLTNLTPASVPENPSQIYTFTLRVTPRSKNVSPASIQPHLIVDGQNFDMKRSALGEGLYEFEYQLPPGRDLLSYYFLVTYNVETSSAVSPGEAYTEVNQMKLARRYVLSLEVNRGPVGARVSVLGRGFTPQDVVYFSGVPARTVCESPNSLSFFVPAVEAGKNYKVALNGAPGFMSVGDFHVDPSNLSVSPSSLGLSTGSRQTLTFTVANPAPPGGTLLDIATDIPESVIMPEVVVPQGQTSVTITVEGGKPGIGNLFLKGYGSGEITIPVTVTGK